MTNAALSGKPYAGNPHVRFDEGEVASEKPRRGSLLYETVFEENPCGGVGRMRLDKLLGSAELADKCGLFAQVTLPPGAVLGYHEHHGNGECYYILAGEGVYDDNGAKRTVKAGDVTWTPDGSGHGLSNADGRTDLVFIALIVNR